MELRNAGEKCVPIIYKGRCTLHLLQISAECVHILNVFILTHLMLTEEFGSICLPSSRDVRACPLDENLRNNASKTVISCSPHLSGIRDRARNLDCFCFVFDLPHSNLLCGLPIG